MQNLENLELETERADFLSKQEKDEIKADLQYLRESNERMQRFEEEQAKLESKREREMVLFLFTIFATIACFLIYKWTSI